MNNEIKFLSLFDSYELDVYIEIESNNNYPTKGNLTITQDSIQLKIYNTSSQFNLNYNKLTCEYHNNKVELINLNPLKYSTDFYSRTKDIIFEVEKLLFKEYNTNDYYNRLIIKSKDINQWLGFTKLQHSLGFEIHDRLFNHHKELFKSIKCENFDFNIFYEIDTTQDVFNGITTYSYLPYIELEFKSDLSYEKTEKIYLELLDLFYLLLGFNLNVDKVILQSNIDDRHNNTYLYYKKNHKKENNKFIFIAFANNLFEQYRKDLNKELVYNYFKLNDYEKSFFNVFRKYKMFHYTEDKLLGYFRILENLMFDKNKLFTEELLEIYINNVDLSPENKLKQKNLLLHGNNKVKSVINKPLKDRKEKIKFIIFHHEFLNILPSSYNIIANFNDVNKIVKLRNDITHFNSYTVNQTDLEKYIDYLELLVTYTLLKDIGYDREHFIESLGFYPSRHKVFHFENN
ncbi:hypothetical protein CRU96_14320 [Malaciobacter halophilus]|nr:hypothetical protein [Malaciobacter halophilus]RYA22201.1 hypothetical protein CRU96_14320 [Malaciobacter halophilus]